MVTATTAEGRDRDRELRCRHKKSDTLSDSNHHHRDMHISSSPSVQPIPTMQQTDSTPADSRVASLKAIFPDFDDAVILSILESTNNDHDRALDVLLGMSDPSFVPPNPPPAQSPNPLQSPPSQRLSQEALDEQFARRLALEEQQAATQTRQPQGMQGQAMYDSYQPRRGWRNDLRASPQSQPQIQGQSGRDTMTEFQEGFSRIAESGKKTFSSIVSKVKAKMQEFDQGQGWSGWSQNPPPNQSLGASAPYGTTYPQSQPQGYQQSAYAQPYQYAPPPNPPPQISQTQPAPPSTSISPPPRSGVSRPSATDPAPSAGAQQPSYYDPNTRGYDLYEDDHEIQLHDNTTSTLAPAPAPAASAATPSPATLPHPDTAVSPPPPSNTSSPPSYASPVSPPPNSGFASLTPATRPLSPTTAGARGAAPGTPGGVDFSKLGLLPKRPISLVRPQSPPAPGSAGAGASAPRVTVANPKGGSTDREEPEFVENPFEDRK